LTLSKPTGADNPDDAATGIPDFRFMGKDLITPEISARLRQPLSEKGKDTLRKHIDHPEHAGCLASGTRRQEKSRF
jgi:hypothetical protein